MTNTSINQEKRVSTGVSGLDTILNGGLPINHLYLIEGDPGTGKTTLALQFLLNGRDLGERVLYVTLSETKTELRLVAESHGWSLDGVELFEMGSFEDRLRADEQYTVFHPAEVELSETTKRICEEIDRSQATRVVFDSLSEVRLLAREPLRYRRQVLALKHFFAGRKCTVLLLDDRTSAQTDLQLQSISHGVIFLERITVEYGGARRRLVVSKMRGLQFVEGHHDVSLLPGGLVVYPRITHALYTRAVAALGKRLQAKSGVAALDSLLGGGLDFGTSVLIMGPAGCGKSSVITQYALALANQGYSVGCYLFEETMANFLERAAGMHMNLSDHVNQGRITLESLDPAELTPGAFAHQLRTKVETTGCDVVIIDSLNGYLNAMPSNEYLLLQLHELLVYLNDKNVLTIFVLAQHGVVGTSMQTPIDVTYLADAIVLLRFFEAFGQVRQAIAVIKKRTGAHERTIRQFFLTNEGISVGEPLTAFEGVLTGIPHFTGTPEELVEDPAF